MFKKIFVEIDLEVPDDWTTEQIGEFVSVRVGDMDDNPVDEIDLLNVNFYDRVGASMHNTVTGLTAVFPSSTALHYEDDIDAAEYEEAEMLQ